MIGQGRGREEDIDSHANLSQRALDICNYVLVHRNTKPSQYSLLLMPSSRIPCLHLCLFPSLRFCDD